MSVAYLPVHPTGPLKEQLKSIRYVFTDLDGTMLAPGSTVLADNDGNPSTVVPETLVALKRAGIEVIPCSGRNRSMLHEDVRVLGLNAYIGEMGGLLMLDHHASRWEYYTADMAYDPACGLTPHQVIERLGVCDQFIERWPGLLEYHNDMATGYRTREVTVAMRGEVPDAEARAMLAASGANLDWGDNGHLNYISAPTTLHLPEGVSGRAFNISPGGLNKGGGIERFCAERGIDPAQTLAIGDSSADYRMAEACALFCLVENGLKNADAPAFLERTPNAYVTHGRIVEGWAAAMRALLEARED